MYNLIFFYLANSTGHYPEQTRMVRNKYTDTFLKAFPYNQYPGRPGKRNLTNQHYTRSSSVQRLEMNERKVDDNVLVFYLY